MYGKLEKDVTVQTIRCLRSDMTVLAENEGHVWLPGIFLSMSSMYLIEYVFFSLASTGHTLWSGAESISLKYVVHLLFLTTQKDDDKLLQHSKQQFARERERGERERERGGGGGRQTDRQADRQTETETETEDATAAADVVFAS